eukprot:4636288-Prymnesium_polylepis.2
MPRGRLAAVRDTDGRVGRHHNFFRISTLWDHLASSSCTCARSAISSRRSAEPRGGGFAPSSSSSPPLLGATSSGAFLPRRRCA